MTVLLLGKAFVMSLKEAFTFRLAIKNRHFNSEFSNKTVESIKVFSTPLTAARIICRILYLHTKYVETPENGKHQTLYLLRVSVDKMFTCQYLFVKNKGETSWFERLRGFARVLALFAHIISENVSMKALSNCLLWVIRISVWFGVIFII